MVVFQFLVLVIQQVQYSVDYLVVAGGGGSGKYFGGGGGGGGYRESSGVASGCYSVSPLGACVSALPVSVTTYPITVGGGGATAPGPSPGQGTSGSNSVFSSITSTGGGYGNGGLTPAQPSGGPGGSGGGGSAPCSPSNLGGRPGGTGNTPPVSPPQGNIRSYNYYSLLGWCWWGSNSNWCYKNWRHRCYYINFRKSNSLCWRWRRWTLWWCWSYTRSIGSFSLWNRWWL
jgi:hypothetical protein